MGSAAAMLANSSCDAVARAEGFMVPYAEGPSFGGGRNPFIRRAADNYGFPSRSVSE
jgi:poly(3-hydroxybutyrate) depolymerase